MISVVIPTVDGREEDLDRCVLAYETTAKTELEYIILKNRVTCGQAWEEGAAQATGEYLHLTADDLVPHDGWDEAAMRLTDRGLLPAAVVYKPSGQLETCAGTARLYPDGTIAPMYNAIPFFSAEQWQKIGPMGPMAHAHYYTDNYLTWRARKVGIEAIVCHAYAFTHYTAQPGRGAGMTPLGRMDHDRRLYERARQSS